MSLRSPIGRVRGLGSAKEGTQHWWSQRVTAIALVPLVLWLVVSILSLRHAEYAAVVQWMGQPLNSALLILLIITLFYHAMLGVQVVIEDYVHTEALKVGALLLAKFILMFLAAVAVIAVLRVLFMALLPASGG